jgi:hypothetical protein
LRTAQDFDALDDVPASGLSALDHHRYGERLPRSNARELTGIADRVNDGDSEGAADAAKCYSCE